MSRLCDSCRGPEHYGRTVLDQSSRCALPGTQCTRPRGEAVADTAPRQCLFNSTHDQFTQIRCLYQCSRHGLLSIGLERHPAEYPLSPPLQPCTGTSNVRGRQVPMPNKHASSRSQTPKSETAVKRIYSVHVCSRYRFESITDRCSGSSPWQQKYQCHARHVLPVFHTKQCGDLAKSAFLQPSL